MEYHIWKLCEELETLDPQKTGVRKLQNRIKTMKEEIKRHREKYERGELK
jgi:hypothetical protein